MVTAKSGAGARATRRTRSTFREYVEAAVWAAVLMVILRAFVIQAFRIPSESMLDTLLVGDFLFVNRFEYSPKIPFTETRLPALRAPHRGDVIVFQFPQNPSQDFIKRCIAIALQSPTGSNLQGWHFVVVTDAAKRRAIGELYSKGFEMYRNAPPEVRSPIPEGDPRFAQTQRIIDSASYLADRLHEAPVMVIPCTEGRVENAGVLAQASMYGSILPAAWSFMLALRARGVGAAWTTLALIHERELAKLLGIPDGVTLAVMLPIGYYTGDDFKPAKRLPARDRTYWNTWGDTK